MRAFAESPFSTRRTSKFGYLWERTDCRQGSSDWRVPKVQTITDTNGLRSSSVSVLLSTTNHSWNRSIQLECPLIYLGSLTQRNPTELFREFGSSATRTE